jgi:hypothetical protein
MNFLYSLYPPLAPLGETRGAKVGVSGKVGRDRTPPFLECKVTHKEMLALYEAKLTCPGDWAKIGLRPQ